MIKFLSEIDENIFNRLTNNHYSRKIKSNFLAYGVKYEFSRFFIICEDGIDFGLINLFNSSMTVSTFSNFILNENFVNDLVTFINMNLPDTIEIDKSIAIKIKQQLECDYKATDRMDFKFCEHDFHTSMTVNEVPQLDKVFNVVSQCFPSLKNSYQSWITDTSHRIRHGLSQIFMIGDFTTAYIHYIIDGCAVVGQVATLPESRGHHHARELLYYIGDKLSQNNIEVHLFARSHRVSYYKEIGFLPLSEDIVFERK